MLTDRIITISSTPVISSSALKTFQYNQSAWPLAGTYPVTNFTDRKVVEDSNGNIISCHQTGSGIIAIAYWPGSNTNLSSPAQSAINTDGGSTILIDQDDYVYMLQYSAPVLGAINGWSLYRSKIDSGSPITLVGGALAALSGTQWLTAPAVIPWVPSYGSATIGIVVSGRTRNGASAAGLETVRYNYNGTTGVWSGGSATSVTTSTGVNSDAGRYDVCNVGDGVTPSYLDSRTSSWPTCYRILRHAVGTYAGISLYRYSDTFTSQVRIATTADMGSGVRSLVERAHIFCRYGTPYVVTEESNGIYLTEMQTSSPWEIASKTKILNKYNLNSIGLFDDKLFLKIDDEGLFNLVSIDLDNGLKPTRYKVTGLTANDSLMLYNRTKLLSTLSQRQASNFNVYLTEILV